MSREEAHVFRFEPQPVAFYDGSDPRERVAIQAVYQHQHATHYAGLDRQLWRTHDTSWWQ